MGKRVIFMILGSRTKQGQELRAQLRMEDDHELIRQGDVLLVIDGKGKVEVSK